MIQSPPPSQANSFNELRLAYQTPAGWGWHTSGRTWIPAAHLVMLNLRLIDLAAHRIDRLMVFMPPRAGKSQLCSKHFPGWYMGRNPTKRFTLASFDSGLAASFTGEVRDALTEFGPAVFGVKPDPRNKARHTWRMESPYGGEVRGRGIQTPLTGTGADILGIDDPIKDASTALSKTHRDNVWNWYQSTAERRLQPDGGVLLVQTRWNMDDLAGRMLDQAAKTGDKWTVVSMPAIATTRERYAVGERVIWEREPGDPLWPEMWPLPALERIKRNTSDYWWSAMYQQTPVPEGGAIVKRSDFENSRYDVFDARIARSAVARFISIDTAQADSEENNYSVATVADLWPDYRLALRRVYRVKLDFPAMPAFVDELISKWNADGKLRAVVIESKSTGTSLYQTLKLSGREREYHDLLFTFNPTTSKTERLSQAAVWVRNGSVMLPHPHPDIDWLYDWEEEVFRFPVSAYDDQVDSFSQTVLYVEHLLADGLAAREGWMDDADIA